MANIDLLETQEELQWLEKKLDIKSKRLASSQRKTVKRGEVYGCDFGYNLGSELRGYHPCVIIQNNATSVNLQTVCVAPITHASSRTSRPASLVPIAQQKDTTGKVIIEGYADIANLRALSKARLTKYIATLSTIDMQKIDAEIAAVTDLYGYYKDAQSKIQIAQNRADAKEEKIKKLRKVLQETEKLLTEKEYAELRETITEALKL